MMMDQLSVLGTVFLSEEFTPQWSGTEELAMRESGVSQRQLRETPEAHHRSGLSAMEQLNLEATA